MRGFKQAGFDVAEMYHRCHPWLEQRAGAPRYGSGGAPACDLTCPRNWRKSSSRPITNAAWIAA